MQGPHPGGPHPEEHVRGDPFSVSKVSCRVPCNRERHQRPHSLAGSPGGETEAEEPRGAAARHAQGTPGGA
eukprot:12365631-Alexandrium_andersonii.AAC.1